LSGILDGTRIVDLSDGIAGSVSALLLAESGADVVVVEPPGGLALRSVPGFRTWLRSKRSVTADLDTDEGRQTLERLLASADVVIHQLPPSRAQELGVDDASIASRHPHLIACSVLSWPANHPDCDRPVDDLLAMARLGICDEQLPMRRDGPVFVRFPLGSWGAAYLAAIGVVARLVVRGRTGHVGPVHTSLVQGALVPMGMHWSRVENPSPPLAMGMPKETRGSQATLFECSDGVWIHLMRSPDLAPAMQEALAAMGEEAVAKANATQTNPMMTGAFPNLGANAVVFRTRPSAEWLAEMWANDISAQPALPYGAIFEDEQARANGYVIELDDPDVGTITVPGLPLTIDPPQRVVRPAPKPGAHTSAVLEEWEDARSIPTVESPPPRWPLEGVHVLDLGNYLAGPYGPMLMADLGADVIKLEATTGDPMRWAGWPFAGCQRGKRTIAVDLKDPKARPVLEALVRWADIVHHNLRMPAARRLGVDYESLSAINPDLVYCHTSSYGPQGPRADWPGYDQLFQAQCGWEVLGAGAGNPPMWHRFGFMDHQCALSSVVATLLGLLHRDRKGAGQQVAASLLGAGALTASETYVAADGQLMPFDQLDAEQTGVTPGRRIVELADGWIAIAAEGDDQLASLCRVAGVDDPGKVVDALASKSCSPVLEGLERAGVPAELVRQEQRYPFFDDPANRAAGLVAQYVHAEWGKMEQPGAMWDFDDLETRFEHAPPALGEHSIEILGELGFSEEETARLIADKVVLAL
jgi:crotonobetainyl-CoA:carnitine CoA-transferase CaiB-like acyl-CoA transferase